MKNQYNSPWVFDGQSVLDTKGKNVCIKPHGHLIAASPKLLETLKKMHKTFFTESFQISEENEILEAESMRVIAEAEGNKP